MGKKSMFKHALVISLCLRALTLEADDSLLAKHHVDSLMRKYLAATTDEERLDLSMELSKLSAAYDMEKTLQFAHIGIALAFKCGREDELPKLYHCCHIAHCFRSEYDSALVYCRRNLDIAKVRGDKKLESDSYFDMAFNYQRQSMFTTSLDYYFKHLEYIAKQPDTDPTIIIRACCNIGEINRRMQNYAAALKWLHQGVATGIERNVSLKSFRLAGCHAELGRVYAEIEKPDSALLYLLPIIEGRLGGIVELCQAEVSAAQVYMQKNDCRRALEYAKQALDDALRLNDINLLTASHTAIAEVYMAMERYGEAVEEALASYLADSISVDGNCKVTALLATAYARLGNATETVRFIRRNSEFNREYASHSLQSLVSDMEIKYQTALKDARIVDLEKDSRLLRTVLIVSGISLLLALVLLFALAFISRQRRRLAEKEKQIVAAKASTEAQIYERTRISRQLHDEVNNDLSMVKYGLIYPDRLEENKETLDAVIKKIRLISHALMSERLKTKGLQNALLDFCQLFPNVHFHSAVSNEQRPGLDIENLLYLCAVEMILNSVHHADAASIDVQVTYFTDSIEISVEDDGCGFDPAEETEGTGLVNIRARLEAFDGVLTIRSEKGKGAQVSVWVKKALL